MGHIQSFEKPVKNRGKAFVTPVDLAHMKYMSMSYDNAPHVGPNFVYSCSFADNPEERNKHWFFREIR